MVFAADQSSDYGYWGWWQGQRVNRRTHDAILASAKLAGTWGSVRTTQGGLSMSVSASALTHAGLDVADIAIDGRPRDVVWKFCTALMKCGAVPFPRGYVDPNGWQDPWRDMKHIHLVMFNGGHAHRQAQDQINSAAYGYRYGRNGLAGHPGPYTGPPQQPLVSWAESDYNPEADVPLTKADVKLFIDTVHADPTLRKKLAEIVLSTDNVVDNPYGDAGSNPGVLAENLLEMVAKDVRVIRGKVESQ